VVRLLFVLAAALVVLGVACSDDDEVTPSNAVTPSGSATTESPTTTPAWTIKPADSQTPASGVCGGPSTTDPATIEFNADVPAPRCLRVVPSAHLRLENQTDTTVDFKLGAFTGSVRPGEGATSELAAEDFLAPGVHVVQSTAYGGGSGAYAGSGEVWLQAD
jgi:hypothetical protein